MIDASPPPAVPELTTPPLTEARFGLATAGGVVVALAAAWFLLKEFTLLLRPLLLAVFLCYVILPSHLRLTRRVPSLVSMLFLGTVAVASIVLLASLVLDSAVRLSQEMPALIARGQTYLHEAHALIIDRLPPWLVHGEAELFHAEALSASRLQDIVGALASVAAGVLTETFIVAIYLMFLLLELGRIPGRVRHGFASDRAEKILAVVAEVNTAMAGYLAVKVRASLVLAIPATLLLAAFGVRFALMWGVLTFVLNFVPYLGSIFACAGPIVLAFLQLESPVVATIVAGLLIAIHATMASYVEPAMTGRAIGLSPLVILIAMSFWGLCWGVIGMLLAIPLTVMLKITFDHIPATRPISRMMADD